MVLEVALVPVVRGYVPFCILLSTTQGQGLGFLRSGTLGTPVRYVTSTVQGPWAGLQFGTAHNRSEVTIPHPGRAWCFLDDLTFPFTGKHMDCITLPHQCSTVVFRWLDSLVSRRHRGDCTRHWVNMHGLETGSRWHFADKGFPLGVF